MQADLSVTTRVRYIYSDRVRSAWSFERLGRAEVAALPRESVETIKRHCAEIWSENFEMRLY
jgi:hypothetical protein